MIIKRIIVILRSKYAFGGRIMEKTFIEMKLFQVKPDRLEQFEAKIEEMSANQLQCEGCISLKYFKRFYTIDGIELGEPPRKLTKIVKCVKYYSYWEFDIKENYGKAIKFFFENYNKELQKLLIAPFDINLGYSV
ncbi:MAG: hypothetical protein K6F88_01845 [Ruminococcus sp.]|nr:hypothetical protein [Ruminococcus sp.]